MNNLQEAAVLSGTLLYWIPLSTKVEKSLLYLLESFLDVLRRRDYNLFDFVCIIALVVIFTCLAAGVIIDNILL